MAHELVEAGVTIIAAFGGPPAVRAAMDATSTIPIVFLTGGNPIEEGLVVSLNRPSGNATGVTMLFTTAHHAGSNNL